MQAANKPENNNSHEAHPSLGKALEIDYPQWVVVENAGTDEEDIWSDHYTFKAALKELENCGGTENGFDIMKRLATGELTTEF
ncbi:hypothetical protein [uncultured Dechloromonas sp.]|uniref:hypothetical protein n=1 Tax=uncultured Dechloromonas sp. TaxID=171719 RepID=UPI0025EE88A4|nr:hypothetical protein [uncultured Dechloromonas sp.]